MTNEIIFRYSSLLSEFFVLSSDPNSASIRSPITQLPDFAPKYASSIQAAFYLRKILDHLTEWVHEFMNLEIPKESLNCLREFLETAGFKFLATLATYWVKGVSIEYI
jgi:exocyst complex component 2